MEGANLTQRNGVKPTMASTEPQTNGVESLKAHPGGAVKHSPTVQILRLVGVVLYFFLSCVSIVITQFLGVPLYWINRDWYYAYMAVTKESFGIAVTTLTHWWAPTVIRISGDASVEGELLQTSDGRVECHFPDRLIMIANHQIYTDWLYLWWAAYTNQPHMHGHIYIILKESLKHIPVVGWGMQFYGFIFMSRKMETDRPRLAHRMSVLKEKHSGAMSGSPGFDPMWLLLFPEGTNFTKNTSQISAKYSEKANIPNLQNALLPRSTGLYFCLKELEGTVNYIYDCTIAYEGVKKGHFGDELYTLRSIYLQGRAPPSVNMHWRKFAIADIPLEDQPVFDKWLQARWHEKDALLEHYLATERFPGEESAIHGSAVKSPEDNFIETEVKLANSWELFNAYRIISAFGMVFWFLPRMFFSRGKDRA